MTPEERAILQALVDDGFSRFKDVIKTGRKQFAEHPEELDALATGQVFAATEAKAKGLVDEIGYLDEAIRIAEGMAGLNGATVVFYHRKNDPARSPYAITPNVPLQGAGILPISTPGRERTRLPMFLFMWQPEPMMEKLSGR